MTVTPGHLLGALEECEPGAGAYEEEGLVYASVVGENVCEKHEAEVKSKLRLEKLKEGDVVYAQVKDVYDQIALLEFQSESRRAAFSTYSYLRISEVQRRYTESFREALRIGDLVRAEVLEIKPLGIYLTTAAPHLGVIKAFCSSCRAPLDKGRCKECGRIESRKWAGDATAAESAPRREFRPQRERKPFGHFRGRRR